MALSPIPTADDWPDEIAALARTQFGATIEVLLPGTPGKYDAKTDSYVGGTPDQIVLTGTSPDHDIPGRPARAQQLRLPIEQAGAAEWSAKRRYRFQIDLLPGDPVITKGMVVRVRRNPRDPSLLHFAFQVTAASNSSHAALRTIETITEFGVSP